MMDIGEKVKIVSGPDEGKTGTILEANFYHQNYMVKIDEPDGGSKFQRIGAEALESLNPKPVPVPVLADITPVVKTRADIPQGAEKTEEPPKPEPKPLIPEEPATPKIYLEPEPVKPEEPKSKVVQEKLPHALSEMPKEDVDELKKWIEKTAVKAVEVYMRARLFRK